MNDCFYEKKDWRVCKNEVSVNVLGSLSFRPIGFNNFSESRGPRYSVLREGTNCSVVL